MSDLLVGTIIYFIDIILKMGQVVVIASIIISWLGADQYNPIVQLVRNITEPMYRPFRRMTQGFSGPIDLSPMIILLIIGGLKQALDRLQRGQM